MAQAVTARIRSVKPDIWTSVDFRRLDQTGKLAFLALITQADDEGRQRTDAYVLASLIEEPDPELVEAQLQTMVRRGMVIRYEERGSALQLTNWADHQRIDRPKPSRILPPPNWDSATNRRQNVADKTSPTKRRHRKEGKGRERRGVSVTNVTSPSPLNGEALVLIPEVSLSPVEEVFDAWKKSTDRTGTTKLDDRRRRLITAALKAYPKDEVLDAVAGWRFSPHHRGENDRGTVYDDLGLILRNSTNIERFRDFKRHPAVLSAPVAKQTTSAFYRQEAERLKREGK